jgi:penicillin-binding protein 1A
MTEVYRRKPVPPDWPRPEGIVSREIDFTTNMLRTQYCPAADVMTEVYIAGTEPKKPCDVHTARGIVLKADTTPAVLVPKKLLPPDTTNPFYIPPPKKAGRGGGGGPP